MQQENVFDIYGYDKSTQKHTTNEFVDPYSENHFHEISILVECRKESHKKKSHNVKFTNLAVIQKCTRKESHNGSTFIIHRYMFSRPGN